MHILPRAEAVLSASPKRLPNSPPTSDTLPASALRSLIDVDKNLLLRFRNLITKYKLSEIVFLEEIDSIPNLKSKVKQMKDLTNWQSTISELEFARAVKTLNPEFVKAKGVPSPDIGAQFLGEKIYFEVKLLSETDEASRVYREIWKIEFDLLVTIIYETLDRDKANRLLDFVTDKINSHELVHLKLKAMKSKKESPKSLRTALVTMSKEALSIPLEPIPRRRTVFFA